MHWLLHVMGTDYGFAYGYFSFYDFWSGFGAILERLLELAVIAGILLHRHNCHERHCFRIGRHTVDGTPWCNRHHRQARDL